MSRIEKRLLDLVERGNQKFTQSLHPGVENILGLRVPDVRNLAKEIASLPDWEAYLQELEHIYMEERMVHGMILGYVKNIPLEFRLQKIREFLPYINSWSVCDTFCSTLKFITKNKSEVWNFIKPYFDSEKEYEVRFAIVTAFSFYVDPEYLDRLFFHFNQIHQEGYYVKMAIAWAVSVCYVKYPQRTELYLSDNQLDDFTQNKAIQKIRESYRVSLADKEYLKKYKR